MHWGSFGLSRSGFSQSDRANSVRPFVLALLAAFSLALPGAANAQFSDSYNFLKAVKDRDGTEATKFLNQPGTVIVNTKDLTTGQTALHIVVARRDPTWTAFLLQKGANPNVQDNDGTTPLMLATQLRFVEGARVLLSKNAKVNQANNRGETALIRAVQLRDPEMVRLLLANGADPDHTDTLAGLSARDYATRDRRASAILAEIEKMDKKKKPEPEGRFFGPQG
ncbi:ankyrin repeat domain-containing protein [Parasphingorhabdus sp. JC815]|uniref:ankyrin repeat domain-containing protein n=1 Tax=Parasphingorhabdus sp. JC815 TaxID=3232140 RepID=UPI003459282A